MWAAEGDEGGRRGLCASLRNHQSQPNAEFGKGTGGLRACVGVAVREIAYLSSRHRDRRVWGAGRMRLRWMISGGREERKEVVEWERMHGRERGAMKVRE